jgi:hypothetical protein
VVSQRCFQQASRVSVEQGPVSPCLGSVTPSTAKQNQFNPPYRFLLSGGLENLQMILFFVNFCTTFPVRSPLPSAMLDFALSDCREQTEIAGQPYPLHGTILKTDGTGPNLERPVKTCLCSLPTTCVHADTLCALVALRCPQQPANPCVP